MVVVFILVKGRYVGLFETARRPGFFSAMNTKMLNFSNSCVEFYYRFLGVGNSSLTIRVFDVHKISTGIENIESVGHPGWKR